MLKILTTPEALNSVIEEEVRCGIIVGQFVQAFQPKMSMLNRVFLPYDACEPSVTALWQVLDKVCELVESGRCWRTGLPCGERPKEGVK